MDGVVVNNQVHTVGGVIQPGQPLLEVVPQNVQLIIDTQLGLEDRDVVYEGLSAQVRITASMRRL